MVKNVMWLCMFYCVANQDTQTISLDASYLHVKEIGL